MQTKESRKKRAFFFPVLLECFSIFSFCSALCFSIINNASASLVVSLLGGSPQGHKSRGKTLSGIGTQSHNMASLAQDPVAFSVPACPHQHAALR